MKVIWLIATNTYREIIRDRILYGLIVFAVLLLGLSLALGELSFSEQARITADFGLMGVHLSAVILAVFVGSTLVSKEIEKRTIFTLLAHAVTRTQFLIAKLIGMLMVIATVMVGLSAILIALFLYLGMPINTAFTAAMTGLLYESAILLSLTILFGVFTSPLLSVAFTIGLFLIGHWLNDLKFFAEKSESESFKLFSKVVNTVFPNLEHMNWKSAVTYNDVVPFDIWLNTTLYSIFWVGLLICLAALIFRRRDFV
jgi:Cu-processing system permease protein